MTRLTWCIGVIFNLLFSAISLAQRPSNEADELKAMSGEYFVTRYVVDGVETPKNDLKLMKVVRDDKGSWSLFIGNDETKYADSLDPKKTPCALDITIMSKEKMPTCVGIYERGPNLIRICFAPPGIKDRPTKFESEKGSKLSLVELQSRLLILAKQKELAKLDELIAEKEQELRNLRLKRDEVLASLAPEDDEPISLIKLIMTLPKDHQPEGNDSFRLVKANRWLRTQLVGKKVVWNAGRFVFKKNDGKSPMSISFSDDGKGKYIAKFFMYENYGGFRDSNRDSLKLGEKNWDILLDDYSSKKKDLSSFYKIVSEEQAELLRKWPESRDLQFEFEIADISLDNSVYVKVQNLKIVGLDTRVGAQKPKVEIKPLQIDQITFTRPKKESTPPTVFRVEMSVSQSVDAQTQVEFQLPGRKVWKRAEGEWLLNDKEQFTRIGFEIEFDEIPEKNAKIRFRLIGNNGQASSISEKEIHSK
jgi:uncharacterized protein (TIGR03067 family)